MTTTSRNDDGGDDDGARRIQTAAACGDNRIRMNAYQTWILLWFVMGKSSHFIK
jgi:hypothetical protein